MKVIILNAGIGKRLLPLTNTKPKCLIEISHKKTLLDYQLQNLKKCKLNDIIILTGPFEEKIKFHINKKYPSLNVQYIHNPQYDKTNYIYSLYLTKDIINDDIILFHGDLIFSDSLLKKIMNFRFPNCVLVNKEIPLPKKDFKAFISENKIQRISVDLSGPNVSFLAPLYKLTKNFFKKWLNQIEKFIQDNKNNYYAEDALNNILDQVNLIPLFYNDANCMEIDDFKDLKLAKKLASKIK